MQSLCLTTELFLLSQEKIDCSAQITLQIMSVDGLHHNLPLSSAFWAPQNWFTTACISSDLPTLELRYSEVRMRLESGRQHLRGKWEILILSATYKTKQDESSQPCLFHMLQVLFYTHTHTHRQRGCSIHHVYAPHSIPYLYTPQVSIT